MAANNKIIIIGLDGATFHIIDKMNEQELPFIKSIIKRGVRATLKSTVPPVTAPAWTTIYTGVNPGKHGIFDFQRINDAGERVFINSSNNEYPCFWDYLSGESLLAGLPLTFPPKETNGILITGNPTPFNSDYTYPAYIKEKLEDMNYLIDYRQLFDKKKHSIVKDGFNFLLKALESKFKVMPYLIEKSDYELIFFVIPEIDMTCHVRWQQEGNNDDVIDVYKETDMLLKQYFEKYLDEYQFVFLSDHGFSGFDYVVYLNEWLILKGWMKSANISTRSYDMRNQERNLSLIVNAGSVYRFLDHMGINDVSIKKMLNKAGIMNKAKKFFSRSLTKYIPRSSISPDWNSTKAYCFSYESMGININLKGREKDGIVPLDEWENLRESIISEMKKEINSFNNQPVFREVFRREEVYSGSNLKYAPDIVFILNDNLGISLEPSIDKIIDRSHGSFHDMDGIFIAAGDNIKHGKDLGEVAINDIAPTILQLAGKKIPYYMDGRVIEGMFETEPVIDYQYMTISGLDNNKYYFTEEEASEIKGNLKDLGYLS